MSETKQEKRLCFLKLQVGVERQLINYLGPRVHQVKQIIKKRKEKEKQEKKKLQKSKVTKMDFLQGR